MDKHLKLFLTIGMAMGGVYVLSEMFKSNTTTTAKTPPIVPDNTPERTASFTANDDFFSNFTAKDEFFGYVANEGDFFNAHGIPVATDEPNFANASGKKGMKVNALTAKRSKFPKLF